MPCDRFSKTPRAQVSDIEALQIEVALPRLFVLGLSQCPMFSIKNDSKINYIGKPLSIDTFEFCTAGDTG